MGKFNNTRTTERQCGTYNNQASEDQEWRCSSQEICGRLNQWRQSEKALVSDEGIHGLCSWDISKMLERDTRLGFKFMT